MADKKEIKLRRVVPTAHKEGFTEQSNSFYIKCHTIRARF